MFKYPSTPHLPWSKTASDHDRVLPSVQHFAGQEVVVTEKLDGENTSLYRHTLHARSLNPRPHPSRSWVKAWHAQIKHLIPDGWRLCGENLYAKHSIYYPALLGYFYLLSVWNENNQALDWDQTLSWAKQLQAPTPTQLYRGPWNEKIVQNLPINTQRCEGYVVRTVKGFSYECFGEHVAKWVRPHHVQTHQHWMEQAVVPNGLKEDHDGA